MPHLHQPTPIPVARDNGSPDIAWRPTPEYTRRSRLRRFMEAHHIGSVQELIARSVSEPGWYWDALVRDLDLGWFAPYSTVLDTSGGIEWPRWFVGGRYNYVHDAVDKWAQNEQRSATPAIVWEGEDGDTRTLTYAQLAREVNRAANALKALGIGPGDRVGIYMPMLPETAVATLAVSRIGAIYTPIFSGFGGPAVAGRLQDCAAKLLLTADGFYRAGKTIPMLQSAIEAAQTSPTVQHILAVPRLPNEQLSAIHSRKRGPYPHSAFTWWDAALASQPDTCATEHTSADDPYMVIYTSGTTGRPKGVVHVHSGFPLKAAQELAHCFDLHAGERLMWLSDIGWMMGPWSITGALMLGATCVMYEGGLAHPQPDRVWSLVERHSVTHLGIAPTAIRMLMGHGDHWVTQHDLGSLVVLAGAGEPWNPEPWRWYFDVVGGGKRPIINYSGGTEVAGGILGSNTLLPIKPCAFSAPVPGMAADIVDHEGNPVRGAVGELALRATCPGTTRGFWGDPQRYLDTYWSRIPGLWVHGDWARIDEDGFWYILGRSDDTIKVAGKRVGPAEVESAAIAHPAVVEAAAIGIPDELKGEALVLFVRLHARHAPTQQVKSAIEDGLITQLGKVFRPNSIHIVADLPRTRNGKILRRLVRQQYLGEPLGDISALENPEALQHITPES